MSIAVAPDRGYRMPLWLAALVRDRWAMLGGLVALCFLCVALGVWLGLWGQQWMVPSATAWAPPSAGHWLGTNLLGQDILARTLAGTATAFEIGLVVAAASVALGALLGAVAGFRHGGWVDAGVSWMVGVLDAIPFYLFVAAVAVALGDAPWSMHLAMIASFWTSTARLVRADVIRIRELEFVEAACALGLSPAGVLWRHVMPYAMPVVLVQFSLVFVSAIKSEVILSFLGIGLANGISWGTMIAESSAEVLAGHYMNFIAASGSLFLLVMGVNLFADGLQDALDPRQRASRGLGVGR